MFSVSSAIYRKFGKMSDAISRNATIDRNIEIAICSTLKNPRAMPPPISKRNTILKETIARLYFVTMRQLQRIETKGLNDKKDDS